jgi:PAB-dependent poly(A)-specific ribonuclease subunit 2
MPFYTEPLLSAWTNGSVYDVGHPAPQIDDDILKSIKTIDFVGYAPNPGTIHRNQIPRRKKQPHKKDIPKFRSEQERELLSASVLLDESGELMVNTFLSLSLLLAHLLLLHSIRVDALPRWEMY